MINLPVVLVDAAYVTDRHLILVDGWPAYVTLVNYGMHGEVHLEWMKDAAPAGTTRSGEATLRTSDLVPCVRWADWIAIRP